MGETVAAGAGAGAIALKVGVELITRVAPTGIAWIKTWFKGQNILVVGQPRAGKTSFVDYFQYGEFANPNVPSPRTEKVEKSAAFTVKTGKNDILQLQVKSAIDAVGQAHTGDHAANVVEFRPHAIIIVLDLTKSWEPKQNEEPNEYHAEFYLRNFCINLSENLRENPSVGRKLSTIILILNKKDDEDASKKIADWTAKSKNILISNLGNSFGRKASGQRASNIPIMPCSLIEEHDKGHSADVVIRTLALSMQKQHGK